MGIFIGFEVTGIDAVKVGMAGIVEKLSDLTPYWREIFAPKYYAMVQDLFATGGRARGGGGKFKGGAWAALSPKYRIWKKKFYPGQPILVRKGILRNSLHWYGTGPGYGGIFEPRPTMVTVGTGVPYAGYHQYGTKRMPARSFLPTPDPAVFAPLMQAWLLKKKGT